MCQQKSQNWTANKSPNILNGSYFLSISKQYLKKATFSGLNCSLQHQNDIKELKIQSGSDDNIQPFTGCKMLQTCAYESPDKIIYDLALSKLLRHATNTCKKTKKLTFPAQKTSSRDRIRTLGTEATIKLWTGQVEWLQFIQQPLHRRAHDPSTALLTNACPIFGLEWTEVGEKRYKIGGLT